MSGRRSRNKGHSFERFIVRTLALRLVARLVIGVIRRGLGQSRGAEVCDVEGTGMWIECKRHKRCNIQAAYQQARNDTDGRPPVAITKDDYGPILVTLSLDDFLELLGG